jgi:hypothetical protein
MGKIGFAFSLDAFLGLGILIISLALISSLYVHEVPSSKINYFANDMINTMSALKVKDANYTVIKVMVQNGTIKGRSLENSILDQIGEFWAVNKSNLAEMIIQNVTGSVNDTSFYFKLENDTFFIEENEELNESFVAIPNVITGIKKNDFVRGVSSRAYLVNIQNKLTSKYLYFGGFIGQGNVTGKIIDIPADADIDAIIVEVGVGKSFNLSINNIFCSELTAGSFSMQSSTYDVSSCKGSIIPGQSNNFSIRFLGNINTSFIGGGYIQVRYKTKELSDYNPDNRQYLPDINGIINIYSSFFVPGRITNITAYLHYISNQTTYFSIGNKTIFSSNGNTTEQKRNITNIDKLINLSIISNNSVPIRISSYNLTTKTYYPKEADVVLITDLSGSMRFRIGYWDAPPYGNSRNCGNPDLYHLNDTRRVAIAKCVDQDFIRVVMNASYPGNKLWLTDFENNAQYYPPDPLLMTEANLVNHVQAYPNNPSGGTCIACALNYANEILTNLSNSSRQKFVVLMTDGIPTHCAGRKFVAGAWVCDPAATGTDGFYLDGACLGNVNDCGNNDCANPINASIEAAKRLKALNVTIHTVGMGPIDTCLSANTTLKRIAQVGNGTYKGSRNASELADFYKELAYGILLAVNQSGQTVSINSSVTNWRLFGDSYIMINYTPVAQQPSYGEIILTTQTDKLGSCNKSMSMPNVRYVDAKATSFSGSHWTDVVRLNSNNVFRLADYGKSYINFGDPFIVNLPVNLIVPGANNSIVMRTGDSETNSTGCSSDNRIIYTAGVKSSVTYSDVMEKAEGCIWTVGFEDSTNFTLKVDANYNGTKTCTYTPGNIIYDTKDSKAVASYLLLRQLDIDGDGKLDVKLNSTGLTIETTHVAEVPSLFGPSTLTLKVTQ